MLLLETQYYHHHFGISLSRTLSLLVTYPGIASAASPTFGTRAGNRVPIGRRSALHRLRTKRADRLRTFHPAACRVMLHRMCAHRSAFFIGNKCGGFWCIMFCVTGTMENDYSHVHVHFCWLHVVIIRQRILSAMLFRNGGTVLSNLRLAGMCGNLLRRQVQQLDGRHFAKQTSTNLCKRTGLQIYNTINMERRPALRRESIAALIRERSAARIKKCVANRE